MVKNIEVELRALISDLKEFKKAILQRGALFSKTSYIHDIYFCNRSAQTIFDVEMHEIGSYSLRLRKRKEGDTTQLSLNTKTITHTGDHHAWEEHEIHVSDFDETASLLNAIGFKSFFTLEKNRHTYTLDDMEINIEDIVDFGSALEIEIMAFSGEEEVNKKKIRDFLTSMGIPEDNILPKSITNIIMKERAFKN